MNFIKFFNKSIPFYQGIKVIRDINTQTGNRDINTEISNKFLQSMELITSRKWKVRINLFVTYNYQKHFVALIVVQI